MAPDLRQGGASEGAAPIGADARRFADAGGVVWTVTEIDGARVPGARGARCLVFQSEGAVRRVWHYPANWRDLPAEALLAISWHR